MLASFHRSWGVAPGYNETAPLARHNPKPPARATDEIAPFALKDTRCPLRAIDLDVVDLGLEVGAI
jgi:hypothetical protein